MNQKVFPDAQTWDTIQTLFDQMVELGSEQQQTFINDLQVNEQVREWLQRLLEGDRREQGLIDQPIERIAGALFEQQSDGYDSQQDTETWTGREFGAYRTVSELGRGGMSIVMLAERADGRFEKQVALKLIKPGPYTTISNERLTEETRILAKLQHPNIAHLLDAGISDDGMPYTAMEHCPGDTLTRHCDSRKLPINDRLRMLQTICSAVHHAHSNLIVHRDLKPSNILVQADGTSKLVDFGIAGILNKSTDQAMWATILTPEYAAPEQFGSDAVSTASDIYALGTLLYELLTDRRPFVLQRDNLPALQQAKQNNEYVLPSTVVQQNAVHEAIKVRGFNNSEELSKLLQGDLDAIVQRALAGDASQRYPSAQAMADDIERYLTHYPVAARTGGRGYQFNRWLRRNRLAGAAITGVIGSLAVGLGVALWQADVARANAARAGAVQDFLLEIFESVDPYVNQQNPVPVNNLVNQQAERINQSFAGQPETRLALQNVLAEVQGNLGNNAQSLRMYHDILAAQQNSGAGDIELAQTYTAIAGQLESQGQLEQALLQAEQAVALAPIASSQDAIAVNALRRQASILSELRRNPETVEILTSALQHREQILQLPDGQALLGNLLADLSEKDGFIGETETALERHTEAMQLYRQAYPELHPEIANGYARLAGIQRSAGQFAQAATASYKAAQQSRQIFGLEHTHSLRHDTSLAVDMAYLKCYAEAIGLYQGVVDRYQTVYGPGNIMTANALLNLSSMKRRLNNNESALADIDQTLAIYEQQAEPATDMQAFAFGIKAQLLFKLERMSEAETFSLKALETMRDTMGENHPQALRIQVGHGSMLTQSERYAEAIEYLLPAYTQLQTTLGDASAHTKDAAAKLAAAYQQHGNQASADALVRQHEIPAEQISAQLAKPAAQQGPPVSQCDLPDEINLAAL